MVYNTVSDIAAKPHLFFADEPQFLY